MKNQVKRKQQTNYYSFIFQWNSTRKISLKIMFMRKSMRKDIKGSSTQNSMKGTKSTNLKLVFTIIVAQISYLFPSFHQVVVNKDMSQSQAKLPSERVLLSVDEKIVTIISKHQLKNQVIKTQNLI